MRESSAVQPQRTRRVTDRETTDGLIIPCYALLAYLSYRLSALSCRSLGNNNADQHDSVQSAAVHGWTFNERHRSIVARSVDGCANEWSPNSAAR